MPCQQPGQRNSGDQHRHPDGNGLDRGHADDALRDRADGCRRQLDEAGAALRADDAREDRLAGACAFRAECHDDAGNQERCQEHEDPAADAGYETERGFCKLADLRLHALHERRQVGMRLRPDRVDPLADDRPVLDTRTRRGDLQRVIPDTVHELLHRVGERSHEHRGRRHDQRRAGERDQGRRQALLAAEPARQPLVKRINGDGQDQGPDHQRQEWRKDLVAQHRQYEYQARTDQHVEEQRRLSLLDRVRLQGRVHRRFSLCAS